MLALVFKTRGPRSSKPVAFFVSSACSCFLMKSSDIGGMLNVVSGDKFDDVWLFIFET